MKRVIELTLWGWGGVTLASLTDLTYQYFFTPSVNLAEIGVFWAAASIAALFIIGLLADTELENRQTNKLSELEQRIKQLEEQVSED